MSNDGIYRDPAGNVLSEEEWTEQVNQAYITFSYGTPYLTQCYGGVETINCKEDTTWTESMGEDIIALVCNRCKHERETYILNIPLSNPDV